MTITRHPDRVTVYTKVTANSPYLLTVLLMYATSSVEKNARRAEAVLFARQQKKQLDVIRDAVHCALAAIVNKTITAVREDKQDFDADTMSASDICGLEEDNFTWEKMVDEVDNDEVDCMADDDEVDEKYMQDCMADECTRSTCKTT